MAAEPKQPATPLTSDPLWQVCALLQKHQVKYVVDGAARELTEMVASGNG